MAATARAVDLTDVKEGGVFRQKRKPAGDYRAKIVKADDHTPNGEGKAPGWVLTIQVEGDARASYPYYLSPEKKQAWKIGAICRAAGLNVKNARVRFDPNKLVNKAIGIALEDDEYNGREKSVIDDVFPISEVSPNASEGAPDEDEYEDEIDVSEPEEEIEEEEEDVPPVRTRKSRQKPLPEPEPEEEEEDEVEEEPEPPKKPVARRRRPAPEPEPEDEEEDEEENESAPPPRKRARRPVAKKQPVVEDDDLDEIELDDLDD